MKLELDDPFVQSLVLQIAKSIKTVMTSRLGSIAITLDMNRIEDSQLSIDANTVRESITQTPKIKPKQLVCISSCSLAIYELFLLTTSDACVHYTAN